MSDLSTLKTPCRAALPIPSQLVARLRRRVIGQERALKTLAVEVNRHYLRQSHADAVGGEERPCGGRVLMVGPSGSGKTLLVRALASELGVPFAYIPATALTQTGYVGKKPEDIGAALLDAAGGDIASASRGIVFLDEVDKLRRNDDKGIGVDVGGYGAQTDLLAFLDGASVTINRDGQDVRFDARQLFVVAAGAFEGIKQIIERRLQEQSGFGFASSGMPVDGEAGRFVAAHLTPDDLIRFGLIEEFVGRWEAICPLEPLTPKELERILVEAEGSPIGGARDYFAMHGVELRFEPEALGAIVARAVKEGTGARALSRVVWTALADVECQLPEMVAFGLGVVVVGAGLKVRCFTAKRKTAELSRAERLRYQCLHVDAPATTKFTNINGWPPERILKRIATVKNEIGWGKADDECRRWWTEFEETHARAESLGIVLRTAEELASRTATLGEFHEAFKSSNTDIIQANLYCPYDGSKTLAFRRSLQVLRCAAMMSGHGTLSHGAA